MLFVRSGAVGVMTASPSCLTAVVVWGGSGPLGWWLSMPELRVRVLLCRSVCHLAPPRRSGLAVGLVA